MKMNKNKPHYQVTFEINMDASKHKTIDVWASSKQKAIKKAEEIIKKDKDIFFHFVTHIKEIT